MKGTISLNKAEVKELIQHHYAMLLPDGVRITGVETDYLYDGIKINFDDKPEEVEQPT